MIAPDEIRELLQADPFKPIRLCLSDGTVHEISHPELGWVAGNRVFVAYPMDDDPSDVSVKQLSILRITRVEETAKRKKKA